MAPALGRGLRIKRRHALCLENDTVYGVNLKTFPIASKGYPVIDLAIT